MRLITPQPELETTRKARTIAILVRESFMYVWLPMRCSSERKSLDMPLSRRSPASLRSSLRQIVYLQSDRVGTGSFDSVNDLDHFPVGERPWGLNKHGLFDPVLVFHIRRGRIHSRLIGVVLCALVERELETLRQISRSVYRSILLNHTKARLALLGSILVI